MKSMGDAGVSFSFEYAVWFAIRQNSVRFVPAPTRWNLWGRGDTGWVFLWSMLFDSLFGNILYVSCLHRLDEISGCGGIRGEFSLEYAVWFAIRQHSARFVPAPTTWNLWVWGWVRFWVCLIHRLALLCTSVPAPTKWTLWGKPGWAIFWVCLIRHLAVLCTFPVHFTSWEELKASNNWMREGSEEANCCNSVHKLVSKLLNSPFISKLLCWSFRPQLFLFS